jgi:aryl-alcohol dehydrogenase-like predicted oxidoreductase
MDASQQRALGASGLAVSPLSLGSWRTFERMSREEGLAVMRAARELGVNFLDDARYDDETGTDPIPTGYSEVLFGELFRAAGWPRDETVVANKLWWEFWPEQSAAQELAGSLGRMRLDHVDLIYALPPPEALGVAGAVEEAAGLVGSGAARAWGVANWSASQLAEASRVATERGVPQPVAAQLPYSVVQRSPVEDRETLAAVHDSGCGVVASFVLAGGVLTAKYETDPRTGRAAGTLADPQVARARRAAVELRAIATDLGSSAAALAVAFVLANAAVASALVGATTPAQLEETARGVDLAPSLGAAELERLRTIGAAAGQGEPTGASKDE